MSETVKNAMETAEMAVECCRLCDETTDKMVSVFDKNQEGKPILNLIKDVLPIIIYKADPFSKKICESCVATLENMDKFKQITKSVDRKHKAEKKNTTDKPLLYIALRSNGEGEQKSVNEDGFDMQGMIDVSTSTEDLPVLCLSCKQAVVDASTVNGEIELNGDLQKIVADTLNKQRKVNTEASDKVLRNRRKKPQPFYHELDDSICSSMTEFTQNTSSPQPCSDENSDVESEASEKVVEEPRTTRKRSRIEFENSIRDELTIVPVKKTKHEEEQEEDEEEFHQEVDYRYTPLSLLQLALNCINVRIVPGYVPNDFYVRKVQSQCKYCPLKFQNMKILALHEVCHMDVEVGEKIDNPVPWIDSKQDADIRNKWLAYFDEHGYEEDDLVLEQSLLIPIEMADQGEDEDHFEEIVTLEGTKPVVKGIPLSEFTKDERKNFYQSIVVGGVKKRFCQICRYIFKDNWAIESHYFSSACYYTCRYCGMRFNKQRHRFDEHMEEHMQRNDPVINDKIYAPSKVNNYMPKVIQPDNKKKLLQIQSVIEERKMVEEIPVSQQLQEIKNRFSKKPLIGNVVVKSEPTGVQQSDVVTSQSKTGNQAFFCRKCYKVFFKLDEFNIHSKNCDFSQFPGFGTPKQAPAQPVNNVKAAPVRNGDTLSKNNRPIRNCAKDIGPYKDEAYIPEVLLKEPTPRHTNIAGPPFVCFICNTPFPTVYSRNSHMRIHKGENNTSQNVRPQRNNFNYQSPPQRPQNQANFRAKITEPFIKQEPLEPEVQIHESESISSIGGGAVSITPIPKKNNQRMTINPDIYKLVQDNPNISLQKKTPDKYPSGGPQAASGSQMVIHTSPAEDKSYKCSSCWEAFANKSHLYFHKKNQCEGSRFPCPFCKKRFGTEAAYSSHIFYSHPE